MKYKSFNTLLALLVVVGIGSAQDPVLDGYLREALDNNPNLRSALDRVDAYDARISQAGALPDPMLGIGIANLPIGSWEFDQEPMTQKWISLGQSFPFPGILSLKQGIARDRRDQQAANADEVKLNLLRQIEETYYRWAGLRESLRITNENKQLMNSLADVALASYKVGRGKQQDILRAQSASLVLEDKLLALHQMVSTVKNRMRTLLNRSPHDSLAPPAALETAESAASAAKLGEQLEKNNPRLQTLNLKLSAAGKQLGVARKQAFPMFKLGARYGQRDASPAGVERDEFFSVEFGTTIPLFHRSKQSQLRQQRQIEITQLDNERIELLNQLHFELTDLLDRRLRLRNQIDVYTKAILPQAQQTVDASLSDYQVGRADFHALIASQQELLSDELALVDRRVERRVVDARLQALVGVSRVEDQ